MTKVVEFTGAKQVVAAEHSKTDLYLSVRAANVAVNVY